MIYPFFHIIDIFSNSFSSSSTGCPSKSRFYSFCICYWNFSNTNLLWKCLSPTHIIKNPHHQWLIWVLTNNPYPRIRVWIWGLVLILLFSFFFCFSISRLSFYVFLLEDLLVSARVIEYQIYDSLNSNISMFIVMLRFLN